MSLFQRQCHGCDQPYDGYYCELCMCPQCGMTIFNEIYDNCIYGAGMPIICTTCGGIVRGRLCLPCDLREKDLYNYDPNAYSFNNFNYFSQPQYDNYLCNLCGNNSHDGYDCQQQFSFVYKQEPSYNQNYDDNYYPHESPSFPCYDYCEESYKTFQCQPDNQNVEFSDFDQIQTPQYPDVNPPSPEISNEEIFQAKGDLMTSIQTFLERFNCIPFEEKPQILFQTWETFFVIQCSQPEDSNELFQKLLKDLKELAEYDQSTSTDRPLFLNDNEDHPVQNKESPENSSEETVVSKTNQEPPQDSDIHQLIEECSVEVPEEQKQKMEDTMLELVKICHHKEFFCIHDDINDLIESTLDSKLLLINSINSQRLDKKEQEVKNVVEQPAERGNRIAPIQSTKEPEHLFTMGYEHFSVTPETESDEVTKSNTENLLPITSKCEVTLEDEIECDMPAKDVCSLVFTTFSNPLFKDNDDLDSRDDESLPDEDVLIEEFKIYSNPLFDEDEINSDKLDPHCFNVESDFVESLLNQIDIVTETDDVLPPSDENDDDLLNDSLLEEADLFLVSDNSIPPNIENVTDDPEGDVRFLEELLINDFILSHDSFDSSFENNPLISRPPPEPPDVESFFDLKPDVIAEEISDKLNKDKCFDPEREIFVSTNNEDVDYFPFMFIIRFFLPYLIIPEISPLFLSAESEDTIFDPGISD
uniref:Pre-mRNA splicing Prp18-interacting factor n=1 Tax=Tanacetum cinerariifolium TaxID=118510 RepID=A0A6L2KRD3_TANCI|nr:hypothetical protein [Tanacetum cinerariifolium]